MDLQHAQNVFFTIASHKYPEMKKRAAAADQKAASWVEHSGTSPSGWAGDPVRDWRFMIWHLRLWGIRSSRAAAARKE
jgi:hypothetical protein